MGPLSLGPGGDRALHIDRLPAAVIVAPDAHRRSRSSPRKRTPRRTTSWIYTPACGCGGIDVGLQAEEGPVVAYAGHHQILHGVDKGDNKFEYGCRFLELNEADQAKITQNIFAVQRQMRGSSR